MYTCAIDDRIGIELSEMHGCSRTGVPKRGPVEFQLQPHLNKPKPANQALTRHTRNFPAGVLRQV